MICSILAIFFCVQGSSASAEELGETARIDIYEFYGEITSVSHNEERNIGFGNRIPVEYHDFCPADVRGLIFYPFLGTGPYEYSTDGIHFSELCEGTEIIIVQKLIVRRMQEPSGEEPGGTGEEEPSGEEPGGAGEEPGGAGEEKPSGEEPGGTGEEEPSGENGGDTTTENFIYTFLTQTGEVLKTISVAANSTLAEVPEPPVIVLYTFRYWSEKGTGTRAVFSALPALRDREFEPYYEKTSALVTFFCGTLSSSFVVPVGGFVSPPDLVTPQGYITVWRKEAEGTDYDFSVPIAGDCALYASYVPQIYTVRFLLGAGHSSDTMLLEQEVLYGSAAVAPQVNPPQKKRFAGWDKDFSKVTSHLDVNAIYEDSICIVTLIFLPEYSSQLNIIYGETMHEPETDTFETFVPQGFRLSGWKEAGCSEYFDFGSPILSSKTLYAEFERIRFAIKYYDGFREITGEGYVSEVEYGSVLTVPPIPDKQGAIFDGWCDAENQETLYDFGLPVVADVSLYARYLRRYSVTAEVSEGIVCTLSATEGQGGERINFTYLLPEGYLLAEKKLFWEGSYFMLSEDSFCIPNADVILYLVLAPSKYFLTVNVCGSEMSAVYGEPFEPAVPDLKEHEVFCGWYSDEDFSQPYEGFIKAPYGQTTYLYPKITNESFEIVFVYGYGGESVHNVPTYYNEIPLPPQIAQQEYLRFDGWDKEIVAAEAPARYTAIYTLLFDKYYYDGEALIAEVRDALNSPAPVYPEEKEGMAFEAFRLESVDTQTHQAIYRASYAVLPVDMQEEETVDYDGTYSTIPETENMDYGMVYTESPLMKFDFDADDPFLLFLVCAALVILSALLTKRYFLRKKENWYMQR